MKIVIDTNVFLSSLFSKNGASYRLVQWVAYQYKEQGIKHNIVSNTIISEFEDVFLRDKNIQMMKIISRKDVSRFIDAICTISHHQKINFLWRPFLKDSNDDMVLEVAFNSNANYIVTFNTKDFEGVEDKFNILIVTPQEFLSKIGDTK